MSIHLLGVQIFHQTRSGRFDLMGALEEKPLGFILWGP